MFRLARPSAAAIEQQVAAASGLPHPRSQFLTVQGGLQTRILPFAFAHDRSRSCIGQGDSAFAAARRGFAQWAMFDMGWVRVANPTATINQGQIVAVEAHSLGLWSLNLSRIVEVVNTPTLFGFLYVTTTMHVEQGEERFLLEFDPATSCVWYELEAVSRPQSTLARLGLPVTRAFQHRFARESHRRMQQVTLQCPC